MSRLARLTFVLTICAVGCALSGCDDKCQRYIVKAKECIPSQKYESQAVIEKDIKQCEDDVAAHKEQTESNLVCAYKSNCDDFRACKVDVVKKQASKQMLATIASALKANDFEGHAMSGCEFSLDIYKGEKDVEDACAAYMDKAIAVKAEAMRAKRDAGEDAGGECYTLNQLAKKRGGDPKIEVLCSEVGANKEIQKALTEAKKNLDSKTPDMPVYCDFAIEKLERIHSEWAKAQTAKVAQACYVDLGQLILDKIVPKMDYVCSYSVDKVVRGVNKFNLQNDTNKPLLEKASKLCDKKQ